ncbi:TetR/AcrR family transcriptional regulator [Rufibacter latericius]|uniref:TetR/AcrR family transcriptional regulator n=1 Tax=Rufibacter latericius TaxID=2487040 RepID=A0A3M9N2G8_9BACT|nr:hypothetical protein [Rufibacter latericius]RNI31218.1 hypothetical protein EFB08_01405 [Rufibacter latericius]
MSRGIEAVSTENLLEALEISRGTLMEIASSKEQLVRHCINHSLKVRQQEVDRVMAEAEHPLVAFLQLLQLSVEEVRSFSPAYVQDLRDFYPHSWARLELFMRSLSRDYLTPLLEECIAQGYLQQDLPPEMVVRLFLHQLHGLLNPQLFPPSAFDYQQLFRIVVVYHLRGCATPLGQARIEAYANSMKA